MMLVWVVGGIFSAGLAAVFAACWFSHAVSEAQAEYEEDLWERLSQ